MTLSTNDDKWQQLQQILALTSETNDTTLSDHKRMAFSRFCGENILVLLLQYIGLSSSTLLAMPNLFWPASGTAVAFIFLRGNAILPGIGLGCFFAYYLAGAHCTLAISSALLFILQTVLLRWTHQRYINPSLYFWRLQEFFKFILCALLITGITSFCLVSLYVNFALLLDNITLMTLQWWLANFNGILIIACSLITWDMYFSQIHLLKPYQNQVILFAILLFVVCLILLLTQGWMTGIAALFLLSMIFYSSLRLGWCGAITSCFGCAILFNIGAVLNAPFFSNPFIMQHVLTLQLLIASVVILSLSFSLLTFVKKYG